MRVSGGIGLGLWECVRVLEGYDESFWRHRTETLVMYQSLGGLR